MKQIDLREKFSSFDDVWVPRVIGELNGQYVKAVKFLGEYVWHSHKNEDELFLVIKGSVEIHFRDKIIRLGEGQLCIVPRGVEHKPVANELCQVLLFEPATTRNTGSVDSEFTIEADNLERL